MLMKMTNIINIVIICGTLLKISSGDDFCSKDKDFCFEEKTSDRYSKDSNKWTSQLHKNITLAMEKHIPCKRDKCKCYKIVSDTDFIPFEDGITKEQFEVARARGTKYQIINSKLYREKNCHFPARCDGIQHYLTALAPELPNMELAINTRDWPQLNKAWGQPKAPVFSFSKTQDYYDIMYPAWSFWEGGPAISLYPTGIGRWDEHRLSISAAADKWPWEKKQSKAFFRGSRTSEERDALVLLSRANPELVDAQYTKNQAWKSDADTLYAPPASEVSFEEHCKYKYLFNYRGVAASFRFKHLFLCRSLVFHVGDEWQEFYYPLLKPWVHYVPISPTATKEEIKKYINFFKENDSLAKEIAERGYKDVWERLTDTNVMCYWEMILRRYAHLVKYDVTKDKDLVRVK